MQQGRTVFLYARAASAAHESPAKSARRSLECVKKYARVAYVILCNFVCKVRRNECTHGDEKPPPPIRDGWVYRGKERIYGGKEWVQGRRWRSSRRGGRGLRGVGGGAEPPAGRTKLFYYWDLCPSLRSKHGIPLKF